MTIARRSLPEVLQAAIDSHMAGVHVALPAKVVSYDAAKQTITAKCAVKLPLRGEFGETVYEEFPEWPEVPVAWPMGGGYFVALPLAAGDPVLLVFSDVATGEYLNTGLDSEPVDTRRHSNGYPVAIPGGARPDTKAVSDASASAMVLGKDSADTQIAIDNAKIQLGKGATEYVALATLVETHLETIRLAINGIASGAIPAPFTSVAATKVKAK